MENRFEFDYRVYVVSGVTCPICGLQFAVRLNYDYLATHRGEELNVICLACGQKQIKEGKLNGKNQSAIIR